MFRPNKFINLCLVVCLILIHVNYYADDSKLNSNLQYLAPTHYDNRSSMRDILDWVRDHIPINAIKIVGKYFPDQNIRLMMIPDHQINAALLAFRAKILNPEYVSQLDSSLFIRFPKLGIPDITDQIYIQLSSQLDLLLLKIGTDEMDGRLKRGYSNAIILWFLIHCQWRKDDKTSDNVQSEIEFFKLSLYFNYLDVLGQLGLTHDEVEIIAKSYMNTAVKDHFFDKAYQLTVFVLFLFLAGAVFWNILPSEVQNLIQGETTEQVISNFEYVQINSDILNQAIGYHLTREPILVSGTRSGVIDPNGANLEMIESVNGHIQYILSARYRHTSGGYNSDEGMRPPLNEESVVALKMQIDGADLFNREISYLRFENRYGLEHFEIKLTDASGKIYHIHVNTSPGEVGYIGISNQSLNHNQFNLNGAIDLEIITTSSDAGYQGFELLIDLGESRFDAEYSMHRFIQVAA